MDFTFSTHGGLTTCGFVTSFGKGVIDEHWPGLYEVWDVGQDRNPYFRFAVNNNNQEEMAVYLGFAWAMTELPVRLAVLSSGWHRSGGRSPEAWATWEYTVDAEASSPHGRSEGFSRARSAGSPVADNAPADHAGRAGLYELRSPDDLTDLAHGALSDAWGEVTLFGLVDAGRRDSVVEALSARRKPEIAHTLKEGDCMVHLVFGVDLGYYDSILVVGLGIEDRVRRVAARFDAAAAAYQRGIGEIQAIDDMLSALRRLRDGVT